MSPNPTACFALCCAAGVLLGFLLHLLELPRHRPLWCKALCDLLFCGLCTLVLMLLTLTWNDGMLRLFQPVGLLLGMMLYFCGFGVLTRHAFEFAGRITGKMVRKVKRLFIAAGTRLSGKKGDTFLPESD